MLWDFENSFHTFPKLKKFKIQYTWGITTKIFRKGSWVIKRSGGNPARTQNMVLFHFYSHNFKSWYKEYNKYTTEAYSPKLDKKQLPSHWIFHYYPPKTVIKQQK